MPNAIYKVPAPKNEHTNNFAPGTMERKKLNQAVEEARSQQIDVFSVIGGHSMPTDKKIKLSPPHDHNHTLGYLHEGDKGHVEQAIKAAMNAKKHWASLSWEHRAAIFLKAADLLSDTYRYKINAATMLGQSKNAFQAEIDSVCEFIDFLRFNVAYMNYMYEQQPISSSGVWNRIEYRPLEGFVFAVTPFNFTAIAGNLAAAPALMGNTVVWKPTYAQAYSSKIIMDVFKEAGLPDGVINMVFVDPLVASDVAFKHKDFGGLHFTGSTSVFQNIWKQIAENIHTYKSYPRMVAETGGKGFVMVHPSANASEVTTALARGAFEYQGQKCSAASRAYIPNSLWAEVKEKLLTDIRSFKMGGTEDMGNFINAVIHEKAFNKITDYIEYVKSSDTAKIIVGGDYDKSKGYFIEPTVVVTEDPMFKTLCEEIFGPVLTIYVYQDQNFEQTLELINQTSPYALTGAIFSKDRYAIDLATEKLRDSAGNFYINDKPTGAVVGQQPFGGARASGTNDKGGGVFNLLRWVSPRTIKEVLVPPTDYRYPFLE